MPTLFESLKERRVFQVGAAYAVIAWGAVQVALTVAPELGLPDWFGRATIWAAIIGFPVAVALAWAYDLSGDGVRRWRLGFVGAVMVLVATGLGVTLFARGGALPPEEVDAVIAQARQLESEGSFLASYDLLEGAGLASSEDERIVDLLGSITETVEIRSEPEGARVFLATWRPGTRDPEPNLLFVGETPLSELRLPRAIHYLRFELDGHRTAERPLTTYDRLVGSGPGSERLVVMVDLEPEGEAHPDMVRVPGGTYELSSADVRRGLTTVLDEYLIDRFEVTNREYADFVRAGGYEDARYWVHAFVQGTDTLTFEEATRGLVDGTGLPGPRYWSGQQYPAGSDELPVVGVSWYEAAAYATYVGKELPTVFQWEKAARDGQHALGDAILLPWGASSAGLDSTLANFRSSGATAVDAMPFGISPYGVHAMAGNVSEWLFNGAGEGRAVSGGSWSGPPYTYSEFSGFDPFFASRSLGFRLVYLESGRRRLSLDQGGGAIDIEPMGPSYEPVGRADAKALLAYFDYDPVDPDPEMGEEIDEGAWIRQDLSIRSPFGDRIPVFLYLPKAAVPPYQTLVYVPSGAALGATTVPEDAEWVMGPIVRSGRAVLTLALTGMSGHEHPPGWEPPEPSSVRFRDEVVRNAVEMRVGIDYLASREDIDVDRLGYSAFSFGAGSRGALLSSDPRFSLALLFGAGIDERVRPMRPEVDPVNYAPYLEIPILVVQGRHDEEHPYYTRFLPLYELLPEEWTTLELVPGGGHLVRPEDRVPVVMRFLEEHWGPVRR